MSKKIPAEGPKGGRWFILGGRAGRTPAGEAGTHSYPKRPPRGFGVTSKSRRGPGEKRGL
jgi:hypothetical protein